MVACVMNARLEGVTVLADDVGLLAAFYRDALAMTVAVEEEHYVAFGGEGIRFAVFARAEMSANTHDNPGYRLPRGGQTFELNFECASESEVDALVRQIESRGGAIVASPVRTAWGHYAAFFADPEGNIHSLFATIP